MNDFSEAVETKLNERLCALRWPSDKIGSVPNELQTGLINLFSDLLKVTSIRQHFFNEYQIEVKESELSDIVSFCLGTEIGESLPASYKDYYNDFYLIFSEVRAMTGEAASRRKSVKWKNLRKQIFVRLGIKRERDWSLRDITTDESNLKRNKDEPNLLVRQERTVDRDKAVNWLDSQYRLLTSEPVQLPTMLDILKILREEVKRHVDWQWEHWMDVWDAAELRLKANGITLPVLSAAAEEAFVALLSGELESLSRQAVLDCFVMIFFDSRMPEEGNTILRAGQDSSRGPDSHETDKVLDFFSSLVTKIAQPSNESSEIASDDQFIQDEFIIFSEVVGKLPILLAAETLAFMQKKAGNQLNQVPLDLNDPCLRTIIMSAFVTQGDIRGSVLHLINDALEAASLASPKANNK